MTNQESFDFVVRHLSYIFIGCNLGALAIALFLRGEQRRLFGQLFALFTIIGAACGFFIWWWAPGWPPL